MPPHAHVARLRRFGLLALLYAVQGLPYGFQASALAVYLRERGVSLTHIGLVGILALPWSLKALWAPLVDRHGSPRFGRRKSWIVPMQALLALAMLAAAFVPTERDVTPLLLLVLVMNLFAATMDIAVDGLAVDVLSEDELGTGNAIQVVGYKVGMLTGGGILVWASARVGWLGVFGGMAALTALAMLITIAAHEPRPGSHGGETKAGAQAGGERERAPLPPARVLGLLDVLRILRGWLARPGSLALLGVVFTYKMADSLVDPMFLPYLVDRGVPRETIGLWVGTIGMGTSIAGSLAGGLLASRVPLSRALLVAGALRALPLLGVFLIVLLELPPAPWAAIATGVEHFFSGMLTTTMFALMMSRTDRTIGATHYTFLATIEVLGKAPLSLASGAVADGLGYAPAFGIAVALALTWSAVAPRLVRAQAAPATP